MTKRQTARDRIEAERQRVLAAIADADITVENELSRRGLLLAELAGVEAALTALGPVPKRQSANGAAKPRKVKPADPQLPIGA